MIPVAVAAAPTASQTYASSRPSVVQTSSGVYIAPALPDAAAFSAPKGQHTHAVNPFQATQSVNRVQQAQPKFGLLPDFGLFSIPLACLCCCCALPIAGIVAAIIMAT